MNDEPLLHLRLPLRTVLASRCERWMTEAGFARPHYLPAGVDTNERAVYDYGMVSLTMAENLACHLDMLAQTAGISAPVQEQIRVTVAQINEDIAELCGE